MAHGFEPVVEVGIGWEMAKAGAIGLGKRDVAGAHGDHRSQTRCITDAAAVAVKVVRGKPVVGMIVRCPRSCIPGRRPFTVRIVGIFTGVIAVHDVGKRWYEHANVRLAGSPCRPYEEGDHVPGLTAAQTHPVNAARHVTGNREDEVGLPVAVMEIVIMKVNGAVLIRRVPPAHLLAGPVRARHGTGGKIHELAVKPVGSDIHDPCAGNFSGKIETQNGSVAHDSRRRKGVLRRKNFCYDGRTLYLAVVVAGSGGAGHGCDQ